MAAAVVEVQPCQCGAEEDDLGEATPSGSGERCDGVMVAAACEEMDLNVVVGTGAEVMAGVNGLGCLRNWPIAGLANGATGTSVAVAAEGSWDCCAEQEILLLGVTVVVVEAAFVAKLAEAWLWVANLLELTACAAAGEDHYLQDLHQHLAFLP